MSDAIILNGLVWDKENLSVNGNTYFTYQEAKIEASKLGKRLPTEEEFDSLLKLPHEFDLDKRGMLFAEKAEDLKTEKSLFFPAAGYIDEGNTIILKTGINGRYWSNTTTTYLHAANLSVSSNCATMFGGIRKDCFSVRCVSDIKKQEIMKTNQEIEFNIPEGYVIDSSKSTENKIVCKPIEPQYPKIWEDAFWAKPISGFDIKLYNSDIRSATSREKALFKTKKQAESSLAYAQLTQLMALPCYNGDWMPDWNNLSQIKYCIERLLKYNIVKLDFSGCFSFLAFKSKEARDVFLENHLDLIRQFYQL